MITGKLNAKGAKDTKVNQREKRSVLMEWILGNQIFAVKGSLDALA
jgi:hypothetical protein